MNLYHTVAVTRDASSVASGTETHTGYAAVSGMSAVPCLVEPISSKNQLTILGTIAQKTYRITWGTEAMQDGDRITWLTRVFRLQYDADDQYRAGSNFPSYQTGILTEEAFTRA